MLRGRRSLWIALAAGAALAAPAAASAAPVVTGTAVLSTPQDCQAGCIGMLRVACAATDPLSVRTTVTCSTRYESSSATMSGPAAVAEGMHFSPMLSPFTLCVTGTSRYANGSTATKTRCMASSGGAAVVAG